jgi:hypothetical protein
MRGDSNRHGMRGWTRKKEEGLAESGRVLTSQSDPIGLSQAEAFRNSLADSVSFRFPSWLSLDGAPLLRRSCSALCQALRGGEDMTWSFGARTRGSTRLPPKDVGKRAWKDYSDSGGRLRNGAARRVRIWRVKRGAVGDQGRPPFSHTFSIVLQLFGYRMDFAVDLPLSR